MSDSYTILIDLEKQALVNLLAGRESENQAKWFRASRAPKINIAIGQWITARER